ncbi:unnamed protein product [marine sediment metagenome]|uniref:Uncharacterized protein n=1 Tax=marine sediment metagenome TaxID=412755 RepID=X1K5J5_9ZZZZ
MHPPGKPPTSMADFKGKPPFVQATKESDDEADALATQALLQLYTGPEGFKCPRCGVVITAPEDAINHLEVEINKALARLGKPSE